jgi:uncharacterized membrane protein YphA (DoxX/SURF4 family)
MYISIPTTHIQPRDSMRAIAFRFIVCYLLLYIWPFPFQYIPFLSYALTPIHTFLSGFVDSVAGPALFGNAYSPLTPTGSGDTSYCYTQCCLFAVTALVACLLWTVIDRKRTSYQTLAVLFDTTLRFYLAATLFTYGFIKVFPLQFPAPGADRLAQSYGESSPMGLLWTFMGSSTLYTAFTGMGEVTAGVLLLFRRTKLAGATLSALVFLHVFVLNLAYDVPVKLFSLHLLLISLYVAAPMVKAFMGRPIPNAPPLAEVIFPTWRSPRARWIISGIKWVLILFIGVQPLAAAYLQQEELTQDVPSDNASMQGIYTVSSFSQNGEAKQNTGWKEVRLNKNLLEVVYADGASIPWHCVVLRGTKKIRLASKDLSTFGEFNFTGDAQELVLTGTINQDSLVVHIRRTGEYTIPLLSRGFHWVSEEPFNR